MSDTEKEPQISTLSEVSRRQKLAQLRRELMKRGPGMPASAASGGADSPERLAYLEKRKTHRNEMVARIMGVMGIDPKTAELRDVVAALLAIWPTFEEWTEKRGRSKSPRKGTKTSPALARREAAEHRPLRRKAAKKK